MSRRLPKVIEPDEFERLASQPSRRAPTGRRNLAALHCMYFAGLRVNEICSLSLRDLNARALTLRVREGKGKKDRNNLGIPADTLAVIERWIAVRPDSRYLFCTLAGGRMSERYVHAMVTRYAKRAGVMKDTADGEQPVNPHVLRHSYATRLIERGVPVHDVQRALGHSSLQTTSIYLHVNDKGLAERLRVAVSHSESATELEALVRRVIGEQLRRPAVLAPARAPSEIGRAK
jgi:integrase/recombinase XerD